MTREKTALPTVLLIAGNGRNIGKTWMACRIIQSISDKNAVTAIKVSSHMHLLNEDVKIVAGDGENWIVGNEFNADSVKDSGRFLKAGAKKVWYAQIKNDAYLPLLLNWMTTCVDIHSPIVCESAALGNLIEPGAALFIEGEASTKKCDWPFDFQQLKSKNSQIQNVPQTIKWEDKRWHIQ